MSKPKMHEEIWAELEAACYEALREVRETATLTDAEIKAALKDLELDQPRKRKRRARSRPHI